MKAIEKVKELLNYYMINRQVGHTHRMINGIKNNRTLIVVNNLCFDRHFFNFNLHDVEIITLHQLEKLRGYNLPMVFDNEALIELFSGIIREFEMLSNRSRAHVFGKYGEWAISVDDGCLRFHPQWNTNSEKTSSWIWKEAWEEVEKLGGYDKVVEMLKE